MFSRHRRNYRAMDCKNKPQIYNSQFQKDKYFDLSTNEEYSDKAINFTYAKFFDKSPTLYLKRNPQRIVVEDWIYNPKEYDPNNRVLKYDC